MIFMVNAIVYEDVMVIDDVIGRYYVFSHKQKCIHVGSCYVIAFFWLMMSNFGGMTLAISFICRSFINSFMFSYGQDYVGDDITKILNRDIWYFIGMSLYDAIMVIAEIIVTFKFDDKVSCIFNTIVASVISIMFFIEIWQVCKRIMMKYENVELVLIDAQPIPIPVTTIQLTTIVISGTYDIVIDTPTTIERQTICVICQSEFESDEMVTKLSCHHMYHSECLEEWYKMKQVCPICQN